MNRFIERPKDVTTTEYNTDTDFHTTNRSTLISVRRKQPENRWEDFRDVWYRGILQYLHLLLNSG
jgi:hypothetical protein